jgi:hypothetical protein
MFFWSYFCKFKTLARLSLIVAMANISMQVYAQEPGLSSSFGLSVIHDENIQKNSLGDEDKYVSFSPGLTYINQFGKHQLAVNYQGRYTKFDELDSFDYEDHSVNMSLNFDHSPSVSSAFSVGYNTSHNAFTEAGSQNTNLSEFNQVDTTSLAGKVYFGSGDSKGQIVVSLSGNETSFAQAAEQFRNSSIFGGSLTYFHRVAPNTRVLFEVSTTKADFDESQSAINQSNTQTSYLLGFSWRYSEQVYTNFRVGYFEREFEQANADTLDGLSLSIDLNWLPTENLSLQLAAGRNANSSSVAELAGLISTTITTSIEHSTTENMSLFASVEYSDSDYEVRSDKTQQFELGVRYSFATQANINFAVTTIDRDASFEDLSYESTSVRVGFSVRF